LRPDGFRTVCSRSPANSHRFGQEVGLNHLLSQVDGPWWSGGGDNERHHLEVFATLKERGVGLISTGLLE
jgi:hypothetical protein